jgi:hypothetical protein
MGEVLTPKVITVEEQINQQLVNGNVTEAVIANLREKYLPLTIKDQSDKEGYMAVKEARKDCKNLRVLAEKLCKKGREEAVAIQKAWVTKEKEVAGKIGEVEDYLEKQEKEYEAEADRIKAEKKRKQEEQLIHRQMALSAMGVLYADGNFSLGATSYEMTLVKECDQDIWEDTILPKFKAEFELIDAERRRREEEKLAQEAELKRQQEEVERKRQELQEREEALKQDEEQKLKQETEKRSLEAADERARIEKLWRGRLEQLRPIGFNGQEAYAKYDESIIVATYQELISWSDEEFDAVKVSHQEKVAEYERVMEEKRQAEIEEKSRIAAEKAAKEERERIEKAQAAAELKRQQEEQQEIEKMAAAKDKEKWADIISQLNVLTIHDMKSSQYKNRVKSLQAKLEEIKSL